jgi:DNA-binding NarL/FixJ family response regulator
MIRILIVDDHPVVRKGLRHMLSGAKDILIGGEASNGSEAISMIGKDSYDVVLLDISMPGRNGLDVLKQIKLYRPRLSVLMLSMHPEEDYALRCYKGGAAGYLTKDSPAEEMLTAIRIVARGGRYVAPSLADRLPFLLETETEEPAHGKLSDRELQILCMFASGKLPSQIARELSLSPQTISTYKARILEKMKMPSMAHLIRYATENRLV